MSSKKIIVTLSILVAVLLFTNISTYKSYQNAKLRSESALVALEKAPDLIKDEAKEFMESLRSQASVTFGDVMENMKLFNQLSVESERKIRYLIDQRQVYTTNFFPTSDNAVQQAVKIIEVDEEIMNAYRDYSSLQSLHRKRLIEKLQPLGKQLGLSEA